MSVLVKKMSIPVSCYECPMAEEMDMQEDWYKCKLLKKHFYSWDVTEDREEYHSLPEEYHRPKECPLVEVPTPHGKLIDANTHKETLDYYIREAGWSKKIKMALGWVKDEFIDAEPTVIEAEE